MPNITIHIDEETYQALLAASVKELRPKNLQSIVLLRRALGLSVPKEVPVDDMEPLGAGAPRE
jgi:hypothetical protein